MNFYFCENCNKRITDADLAAGKGRDKQMKGVFCQDCAGGVNTIEFEPIADAEIKSEPAPVPLPEARSSTRRRTPTPPHRPGNTTATLTAHASSKVKSPRSRLSGVRGSDAAMKKVNADVDDDLAPRKLNPTILIGGGVVGALVAIVLSVLLLSGKEAPKTVSAEPAKAAPAKPVESAKPPAEAQHNRAVADDKPAPKNAQPVAQDMLLAARGAEDKESKDFDAVMKKIDALPADRNADRLALAEGFVTQYPDSLQASRLRVKMADWKPKPVVAAAAPPEPVPAAEKSDAASSGATKFLFTTSPAGQGAKFYNDVQFEEQDVFNMKGTVAKANAIPDPPYHSTQMSIGLDGKVAAVHLGADSWFRFPCKLENTGHVMVHLFAAGGFYEAHFYGLPSGKWFYLTIKCSDFKRDIRGGDPIPKEGSEVHGIVLYSGENKVPSSMYIGQFEIGDGPVPKN